MKGIKYLFSPLRRQTNQEIKKLVPELNRSRKKILEIGCGKNTYREMFPNTIWLATDIEKHEGMDEIADVTALKYKTRSFGSVFCIGVLEHVPEFNTAVNEIHRVLKKDGLLVLVTPFIFPLHDLPHDYWRFTGQGLKKMLSKFSQVEIKPLAAFWQKAPLGYFCKCVK